MRDRLFYPDDVLQLRQKVMKAMENCIDKLSFNKDLFVSDVTKDFSSNFQKLQRHVLEISHIPSLRMIFHEKGHHS